ncbi:MAG TPA: 30S ribosomal protein S18 [Candidatus Saccharimonadales bacterium]|nr:30S ribosomal protein S18 [Candidatus Saccharimonadales bacterium]
MAVRKKFPKRKITVPKTCYFCAEDVTPSYSEVAILQKFVSGQGKLTPRSRNGICAKHQRRLTSAIKHARHLALMPFVGGK